MPKYHNLCERIIANSVLSDELFHNGTPCWIWAGKYRGGYPAMTFRFKSGPRKGKVYTAGAHRMSIVAFKDRRMTPKMVAIHLCNNPPCVNPEHLVGGSQKRNVRQCVADGRHKTPFRDPDMRVAL